MGKLYLQPHHIRIKHPTPCSEKWKCQNFASYHQKYLVLNQYNSTRQLLNYSLHAKTNWSQLTASKHIRDLGTNAFMNSEQLLTGAKLQRRLLRCQLQMMLPQALQATHLPVI